MAEYQSCHKPSYVKWFSHFRPSQSSFVRTSLMLSGPSLPSLPLPSLLQYLLLVSYRAEDKVMNYHRDNMIAVLFQLLVLGNFVSVEELEGAARTLPEEFHRKVFFGQKWVLTQKIIQNDILGDAYLGKGNFFLQLQLFPVVARTFQLRSDSFFLGPKSWFLPKKSNFCHTTPILVNDPFVARRETVHFPHWERFSTFCS